MGFLLDFWPNPNIFKQMKNYILYISLFCLIGTNFSINAQDSAEFSENKFENIINHNTFYDYTSNELSNTDTIPGFESKKNKLKIYGTIYKPAR